MEEEENPLSSPRSRSQASGQTHTQQNGEFQKGSRRRVLSREGKSTRKAFDLQEVCGGGSCHRSCRQGSKLTGSRVLQIQSLESRSKGVGLAEPLRHSCQDPPWRGGRGRQTPQKPRLPTGAPSTFARVCLELRTQQLLEPRNSPTCWVLLGVARSWGWGQETDANNS